MEILFSLVFASLMPFSSVEASPVGARAPSGSLAHPYLALENRMEEKPRRLALACLLLRVPPLGAYHLSEGAPPTLRESAAYGAARSRCLGSSTGSPRDV